MSLDKIVLIGLCVGWLIFAVIWLVENLQQKKTAVWDVIGIPMSDKQNLSNALGLGYEPFSFTMELEKTSDLVSQGKQPKVTSVMWLKRSRTEKITVIKDEDEKLKEKPA